MAKTATMGETVVIDDFTGGANTLLDVSKIDLNQHSAGQDCWTEFRALSNRRDKSTVNVNVNYGDANPLASAIAYYISQFADTSMNASASRLVCIGYGDANSRIRLFKTDDGSTFTFIGYTVGTVSVNSGSAAVTGVGTAWSTHAKANDIFKFAGIATEYVIQTVNSDTSITLTTNASATITGGAYMICAVLRASTLPYIYSLEVFVTGGVQNLFIGGGTTAPASAAPYDLVRYDGTNVYHISGDPGGYLMVVFKNYLFMAGLDATTLRWSALNDGTTWPANNKQTICPPQYQIRGLFVYGNQLLIFCRNRLYRIVGDVFDSLNPTYYIQEIPVPPNFIFNHPRAVCVHKGMLKFLTQDGIYVYTGSGVQKLYQQLQPTFDALTDFGLQSLPTYGGMKAFVHKNRIWMIFSSGLSTTMLMIDERDAPWLWTLGLLNDLTLVQFSGVTAKTLYGSNYSGGTGQLWTLDAAGTAISGSYTTREIVFPREVEFTAAIVTMNKQTTGNLTFSVSIDRAAFINYTLDMTAGVGAIIRKLIPINRLGKAIRLKVAASGFSVTRLEFIAIPTEAFRT